MSTRSAAIFVLESGADVQRHHGSFQNDIDMLADGGPRLTKAGRLASDAFCAVLCDSSLPARSEAQLAICLLEAAALLRDGWSPGDPVYMTKKGP